MAIPVKTSFVTYEDLYEALRQTILLLEAAVAERTAISGNLVRVEAIANAVKAKTDRLP